MGGGGTVYGFVTNSVVSLRNHFFPIVGEEGGGFLEERKDVVGVVPEGVLTVRGLRALFSLG